MPAVNVRFRPIADFKVCWHRSVGVTYEDEEQLAWQAMEARDFATAMRLLKLLAEQNSAYALMCLGWIYETGAIGEPNLAAAESFYKHAAQLGSPEAHSYLGSLLLNRDELEQAEEAFRYGASLGDQTSQSMLQTVADHRAEQHAADAIDAGEFEEARSLLEQLAKRQSAYALLALGYMHETGKLGDSDANAAISYYHRAVAAGSIDAHRYLAPLLLKESREVEARTAFKCGADTGDISCMYWLGKMKTEGRGGPIDPKEGRLWLEAAAARGHLLAKRDVIALDWDENASMRTMLSRCARLVGEIIREKWKNPDSDKLR